MGRSFDLLPPLVRAQRYREMAEAAFRVSAEAPNPEIRASYLNLAASWHALASSLENGLGEEGGAVAGDSLKGADA